ncbi:MAG TPA: YheC/YheD family protein [Syntrophomonadaceae bacterium]|nr:YheC/YheD family protein [Syntrophomonadaceae bacterium]
MEKKGKIILSSKMAERLGVPPESSVTVRVGQKIIQAKMEIRSSQHKWYSLSPDLASVLHMHKRHLHIRYDEQSNMIHLGPTIGILTLSLPNREEYEPKSLQAELIMLSQIGRRMSGQCFIFTPGSINWSSKTTKGYYYRALTPERGVWASAVYPLPDVVYDRISSRRTENRSGIKNVKERLKSLPYLKYFNPSFLNKWNVHQLLIKNPELHPYLPETRNLNLENLETMLERHKVLYLKPSNGSLGIGIIKVWIDERGTLHFKVHRTTQRVQAGSAQEVLKKTAGIRKKHNYIVQQGLRLDTFKGCPFDLRIIFQKNSTGEWKVSKLFARVASPGSIVANLSRGGKVETSRRVLQHLFVKREKVREKNAQIKNLCLMVATTLEKSSHDLYGELGLDLGIDKNGHPWLLEVNSKPRKTTESDYSQAIARNTFRRPLQYAAYLAGFTK